LSVPLQESLLALIATNSKEGKIAAGLLSAERFDAAYSEFASRLIAYHKKYDKAPGVAHLDDLADDILSNDKHKQHKQTIRTIEGILNNAASLNPAFLLSKVNEFDDTQRLKTALLEASERYQNADASRVSDIRAILQQSLKPSLDNTGQGVFLSEHRKTLSFLDKQGVAYLTGIPEFDRNNFGPRAGRIWLMIGPKGCGKSWFCIDAGKRCLMQHAKVVHYTLENSWEETAGRYYQSFFAIAQKDERITTTKMELDALGRIVKAQPESHAPVLSLSDAAIRYKLSKKIREQSPRFGNLFIQEFPAGSLTLDQLDAHLEWLELVHNFVPNVLILDYPDLMKLPGEDKRIALGNTFVALRGLLQRRQLCGIFPTQGNRSSLNAKTVQTSMISEDVSKIFTSDMVMLYSQTPAEQALGWARLTVANNRGGKDKFTVVVSQSYPTGQFVLSSARMGTNYFDLVPDPGA
jgi:hypothetical protein